MTADLEAIWALPEAPAQGAAPWPSAHGRLGPLVRAAVRFFRDGPDRRFRFDDAPGRRDNALVFGVWDPVTDLQGRRRVGLGAAGFPPVRPVDLVAVDPVEPSRFGALLGLGILGLTPWAETPLRLVRGPLDWLRLETARPIADPGAPAVCLLTDDDDALVDLALRGIACAGADHAQEIHARLAERRRATLRRLAPLPQLFIHQDEEMAA